MSRSWNDVGLPGYGSTSVDDVICATIDTNVAPPGCAHAGDTLHDPGHFAPPGSMRTVNFEFNVEYPLCSASGIGPMNATDGFVVMVGNANANAVCVITAVAPATVAPPTAN